ncbi:M16 family metallopeptidase [Microbulbifer spongiae]|uniref:Insulinase family protein n=1 Tax=Microbulbifer spongiae TaxID=2944933 RepID=A0ABY9EAI4_9GAMM|nr:pitrilysin family protein [Microbulbifer sp. MI-G]WKD49465.1 insulinase family protein [Microbulbifer sp. MI-G]
MKKVLAVGLAVSLAACQNNYLSGDMPAHPVLPQGVNLIEEVKRQGDEIVIPYKKYQLANGLTVIIHEDKSDPLAHVDVTYHVGSAREQIGNSGFAHFFEHMMFQGSENVRDEEHFKIVSESGGTLNGTTNTDRTNYFQTVPVNQLEKMLWLEADRMGFLLDAVTQEKFEVQRETVKNERGQRIDNRPYGRLSETMSAALYPEGHPYSWPVIGYTEDLNRVDVNDLKKFFLRWYGPNNATLTIGGAVDPIKTMTLVNKYFGSIPRGPEVIDAKKPSVTLNEDRYVSFEDNVTLPLVFMTFPTVHARHEDEPALDILAEILGGGKTSILYKNLVKNGLAVESQVYHRCQELACTFNMLALPNPAAGKSLADLESVIRASFSEFEQRGVREDDLLKVKAKLESSAIFGLQSVEGKVSQLAFFETFAGTPNYIGKNIKRYNDVTKEDVVRAYNQYLKNKHAVIVSVVPKGQPDAVANADNFSIPQRNIPERIQVKMSDLDTRRAIDSFDRSKQPIADANPLVNVPAYWETQLSNGIKVLGSQSQETPTTSILIKIQGGHFAEPVDKAGLANLTADLLNESTTARTNEDMSLELQKLGSDVRIYARDEKINILVSSLSKNLDETLALVEEKLVKPAFNDIDFNRLKSQIIQGIQHARKDANALANEAWSKLLYGDSIAGIPATGSVDSVSKLTVADVRDFYNNYVKPQDAELIVVSDLPQSEINKSLNRLTSWTGKGKSFNRTFKPVSFDPQSVYIVNKDKAAQSVIRIGKPSLKRDFTGEFYKADLMNFNLGGAFNSRINLNLREDKGYTYGARSQFRASKNSGHYQVGASVRADATDKSFIEFEKELRAYRNHGMTNEELEFMRKAVGQRDARSYETPNQKLRFLGNILEYDLPANFTQKQAEIIQNTSLAELNSLAEKYLDIDTMAKLVVGDVESLKPQFEELGYKVEVIDLDK